MPGIFLTWGYTLFKYLVLGGLLLTSQSHADALAYVSLQQGDVQVLDTAQMKIKGALQVGGKGPRGIAINADGSLLVTANRDDGNLSIVNLKAPDQIKLVKIGPSPEFVRISGNYAYVTYEPESQKNRQNSNAPAAEENEDDEEAIPGHIAIVDLLEAKVVHDLVGKPETEGLEFTKDGRFLLVTNESDHSVSVFTANHGKHVKTVNLGKYGKRPRGIKISPDGRRYLVSMELSDKVLVLDQRLRVRKSIDTGKAPYGVSYSPDGKQIFVAANRDKLLQVFDAQTYKKIKDIPVGERCWHFSFAPDNSNLMLACGKSNEILVIDAQQLNVTQRLPLPGMPWGVISYPKTQGSLQNP